MCPAATRIRRGARRRVDEDAMNARHARRVVAAVVAAQLAVPGLSLMHEPPSRLGFQMYSSAGIMPTVTADGETVALDRLMAAQRPEIDWAAYLPQQVCRQLPTAQRVTVAFTPDRSRIAEVTCRH
jgi:hypothetical protein